MKSKERSKDHKDKTKEKGKKRSIDTKNTTYSKVHKGIKDGSRSCLALGWKNPI